MCRLGLCWSKDLTLLLSKLNGHNINIDCVLLCEIFLTDNLSHLVNISAYTSLYEIRQTIKRGGVEISINNDLSIKLQENLSTWKVNLKVFYRNIF